MDIQKDLFKLNADTYKLFNPTQFLNYIYEVNQALLIKSQTLIELSYSTNINRHDLEAVLNEMIKHYSVVYKSRRFHHKSMIQMQIYQGRNKVA
jgi:hypothetical protein